MYSNDRVNVSMWRSRHLFPPRPENPRKLVQHVWKRGCWSDFHTPLIEDVKCLHQYVKGDKEMVNHILTVTFTLWTNVQFFFFSDRGSPS